MAKAKRRPANKGDAKGEGKGESKTTAGTAGVGAAGSGAGAVSVSKGGDSYMVPALAEGLYHVHEEIIKRSRFITTIAHTASVEEAKAFIATITAQNPDANHNCFAFNATAPGSTAFCGCSDDGEPKGTLLIA